MEKRINHDYGQTDPDFIDQNTLIDGNHVEENEHLKSESEKEGPLEFGESDPDYVDQNTPVDNDNYAKDEDPYQYQEEFIEDIEHPKNDFESTDNLKSNNISNQQQAENKEDKINNGDGEPGTNKE